MPRDNRCTYMAHVCFYVCCSDCVGVCGKVCCVAAVVKHSVLSLGAVKYVVCLCKGCDGFCVLGLNYDAWSCRCSCMGSMSVSSCRCCIFVCTLLQFSMLRSHDLQFVNAGRGCKRRPCGRVILQSRSHDCLIGSHECLLLFTPSCCYECFYHF